MVPSCALRLANKESKASNRAITMIELPKRTRGGSPDVPEFPEESRIILWAAVAASRDKILQALENVLRSLIENKETRRLVDWEAAYKKELQPLYPVPPCETAPSRVSPAGRF